MPKSIFRIYPSIIILEVFITSIIRRIYIDNIDFTCMGICEGCKRFEVVALNNNVIGSIGPGNGQSPIFILDQNRKLIPKTFFNVFGLIFPHKPVGFMLAEKSQKCRTFIVRQAF